MSGEQIMYFQPGNREELIRDLGRMTEPSVVVAGGTDLLPVIRVKQPQIASYLSLSHMEELKKIERVDQYMKIGSMVTHTELAENEEIRKYFTALSMACEKVGSLQIRNRGTIGGSLVNATPAGDMMPCAFLYHGEMEILNAEGKVRRESAEDFLSQKGRSDIGCGEILTAVWLPVKPERRSCFAKLGTRKEVTISQISLCLSWEMRGEQCCSLEGYMGSVDARPIVLTNLSCLEGECPVGDDKADCLSEELAGIIRGIRLASTRESKLRITEGEKLYKERAVKSVVYDAVSCIRG